MFRPFAPSIMEEHAKKYFDTNYSPYTCRKSLKQSINNKVPLGLPCQIRQQRVQTVNKFQNNIL